MTKDRQLEIAKAIIKMVTRRNSSLKSLGRSALEDTAKETGVSVDELQEFLHPIVREIVDEAFSDKKK